MSQYSSDLSNWEKTNIFLNDKEFLQMQMSLVPIKIFKGTYQTYLSKITPSSGQQWQHLLLLPGTAFKFSNKLNAQYTAESLLSILQIKNIPTKIHVISHRRDPVIPEALTDTLQMLDIILEEQKIVTLSIITWSAGCCHLEEVIRLASQHQITVDRVYLVSPVVDLSNKERPKKTDFLNKHFFDFFQKIYCKDSQQDVRRLSLTQSLKIQQEKFFIIALPVTIVYGSQQFIREDIEDFIKLANQQKVKKGLQSINTKIFDGENHALYSFVTTTSTLSDSSAVLKIAKTKWKVSKYISNQIEQDRGTMHGKFTQFDNIIGDQ